MNQPQTDAELTAWNYGAANAAAPSAYPIPLRLRDGAMLYPMGDAARAAYATLGDELFWQWADRGYYATATATSH